MSDTDRAYCLALAECLENPVAPDGTFLGLTDSAWAAKALRLLASEQAGGHIASPLSPGHASTDLATVH